mgnify:CR=1 FL=1
MNAQAEPILSVRGLCKNFGALTVAQNIHLDLRPGDRTGLIGPNGAGKTTTTRAISGLLDVHDGEITKGSVTFDGERIDGKEPSAIVRSGLTQVLEGRRVFAELTVDENLITGGITNTDRASIAEAHERVMTMFPVLADRRKATAGYLSGGEQQMCAVGRALMSRPETILLDEPSMGLAPQLVEEIFDIIKDLNEKEKVSFLLAEQNTSVALRYAHHGYILESGRVVMDGPAEELAQNPDVKEFYLGISGSGRKSFRDGKHYRRRKRWLA